MAELTYQNFATATELANALVRRGVSFRKAHHIVGSLVGELSRSGRNFRDAQACLAHLAKNDVVMTAEELDRALDPVQVMRSYTSRGGTAPEAVAAMLQKLEGERQAHARRLERDEARTRTAYEACRVIASGVSGVRTVSDLRAVIDEHRPSAA
jgi:argininosuccinate lyase